MFFPIDSSQCRLFSWFDCVAGSSLRLYRTEICKAQWVAKTYIYKRNPFCVHLKSSLFPFWIQPDSFLWNFYKGLSCVSRSCDWECYMTFCKLLLFNMVEISSKQRFITGKFDFPTDFPKQSLIWKFYECILCGYFRVYNIEFCAVNHNPILKHASEGGCFLLLAIQILSLSLSI